MKRIHTPLATLILAALGACAVHATELESTTPTAAKTNGEKWWNGNCGRIDKDIKTMEGKIDIVFVGDSITARWRGGENWEQHRGGYRAINMGIGGDRTQNVLWRLQNGDLDGYKAKLFVVMIGTISKELMHDFLHLAPKGYDVWAESIMGKVTEVVGQPSESGQKATPP